MHPITYGMEPSLLNLNMYPLGPRHQITCFHDVDQALGKTLKSKVQNSWHVGLSSKSFKYTINI